MGEASVNVGASDSAGSGVFQENSTAGYAVLFQRGDKKNEDARVKCVKLDKQCTLRAARRTVHYQLALIPGYSYA